MEEAQIVLGPALPPDQQGAEPIVPARGALDDPATGLAVDTADHRRLPAAPDMRLDAAGPHRGLGVGIVVALVETEVAGSARAARRPEDDGIEDCAHLPLVMAVGGGNRDGQRDAPPVSQEVALDPAFGAVRGVRPRLRPPLGAFTSAVSSEAQRHWIRRWAS